MDQARFHTSAVTLHGPYQPWNNSGGYRCSNSLELRPWSVGIEILSYDVYHHVFKACSPTTFPLHRLRRTAIARPYMKAEFPSWRYTIPMQINNQSTGLVWIRNLVAHVHEITEEEEGWWTLDLEFASCNRSGNCCWNSLEELCHGPVLSFIIARPASSVAHLRKYLFGVPSANSVIIRAVTVQAEEPYRSAERTFVS